MWVSLNIRITPGQDAQLNSVCKTTAESRSDVIRRLITAESCRLDGGDRTCNTCWRSVPDQTTKFPPCDICNTWVRNFGCGRWEQKTKGE